MITLETRNLNKVYAGAERKQYAILNNINLKIKKGEFVALMGPSGSGKSTLLYSVSGMDKMTSGSILLNGQELSSFSEKKLASLRLNQMGFIFQNIYLLRNLSIFDNIILSAYLAKNKERKEINKKACKLMEKMDILSLANRNITQLSGGQLQRAAICRSLINDPDILFADEPTGALNSSTAHEIMKILNNVNQAGTTILLATHDIKIASKTERVLYIMDGEIVSEQMLEKHSCSDKEREKKLAQWLIDLGF